MAVERSRWTDERLDDLAERVMRQDILEGRFDGLEARFDGLDQRFDGLEQRFDRLESRFDTLERAVNDLRSDLYDTRRWMMTMWITGLGIMLGVLVEIALRT